MKKTVAIVGVGLIGGSLGQALRKTGRYRVIGIARRPATVRDALRVGAIDEGSCDLPSVRRADIVVIGTPVDLIAPTVNRLLPYLRPGTIVSDVGSVKGAVLRSVQRALRGRSVHFVGAHPLAGSHRTGVNAARSDLFRGAACVVVPLGKAPINAITALWKAVGARVLTLSAAQHDSAVAMTSHLPHVLAHALVHSVLRRKDRGLLQKLMAGSFRDVTRVASSDPEQWVQIFRANLGPLRKSLKAFRQTLLSLERDLERPALRRRLRASHNFRRPLFHGI